MGNSLLTWHYEQKLPDADTSPPNKSQEMPANRPNVAKYMPGDKSVKMGKQTRPKALKHHRWTSKKKKRSAS